MEAGPELSALVETKLMGGKPLVSSGIIAAVGAPPYYVRDDGVAHGLVNYSGDVGQAFKVVERFTKHPDEKWVFRLSWSDYSQVYIAEFWRHVHRETGRDDFPTNTSHEKIRTINGSYAHRSASTAICRAALLTVGVEVQE
jgi:hypothetical protein